MEITIKDEFIKLGQALKLAGAVSSGIEAKVLIADGEVTVNGETETRRGRKLRDGDLVTEVLTGGEPIRIREIGDHFRLIFRDSRGRWPEDAGCDFPFCIQEEPFAF